MSSLYFDRTGAPIDAIQWADLSDDPEYRFLAQTVLPDGRWVATIWIGIDISAGMADRPYIFETTVFVKPPAPGERLRTLRDRQYQTEAEALAGHREILSRTLS